MLSWKQSLWKAQTYVRSAGIWCREAPRCFENLQHWMGHNSELRFRSLFRKLENLSASVGPECKEWQKTRSLAAILSASLKSIRPIQFWHLLQSYVFTIFYNYHLLPLFPRDLAWLGTDCTWQLVFSKAEAWPWSLRKRASSCSALGKERLSCERNSSEDLHDIPWYGPPKMDNF